MKILYGIQGTGNGHVTRSIEIIQELRKHAHVDVLISGEQFEVKLPFEPDYRMKGLYFVFGKSGGIDYWETYKRIKTFRLLREIRNFPIEQYDLVISDFEPITAWASKLRGVKCIGLSNQAATLHPDAPRPDSADPVGRIIIDKYAPTKEEYGFHFKSLGPNIYTPIIRSAVRQMPVTNNGHITVYLPSYADEKICKKLEGFKSVRWQIFSKHCKQPYKKGLMEVWPIEGKRFLESMASSNGVLCNAGFGTTSEALFLGKKLLVIPMKKQFEQHCNAAMLKSMGVSVMKNLKQKHHHHLTDWLSNGQPITVHYPDQTAQMVKTILAKQAEPTPVRNIRSQEAMLSPSA
jgi:uncharacterized protein (TIGR00661 family)